MRPSSRPQPARATTARTGRPCSRACGAGVARMVDTLTAELGAAVSLSTPVQQVTPGGGGRGRSALEGSHSTGISSTSAGWSRPAPPGSRPACSSLSPLRRPGSSATSSTRTLRWPRSWSPTSTWLDPSTPAASWCLRSRGLLTTACSWSSSKWQHYARAGLAVLRVSTGRTDDRRWMDLDSDDLVSVLAGELAETGVLSRDAVARDCWEARLRGRASRRATSVHAGEAVARAAP